MCGIIGIVSRPPTRETPTADQILGGLDAALAARPYALAVAAQAGAVNSMLKGLPGVLALAGQVDLVASITSRTDQLMAFAAEIEAGLDSNDAGLDADAQERASADLITLKDSVWTIANDRLRTVREVTALAGPAASTSSLAGYLVVQQAFSSIDRLEVRGRDSAGVHLYVWGHDIEVEALAMLLDDRGADPLFQSNSVEVSGNSLSFVYKAAAEIGELGDNTAALRADLAGDVLLRRALQSPDARVALLGHTRWASVGIISEPNAHPVNSAEQELPGGATATAPAPYVVAALNGDVDNHADLRAEHSLRVATPITTDAKVIPMLMSRHLADGVAPVESFRRTVAAFEGSIAIAVATAGTPSTLFLALRGSGQGLYIGLGDDCFIVASEPYGVVEETQRYVRMDAEQGGEIVMLDGAAAGDLDGITRLSYDGGDLPLGDDDVAHAEVTTRDIDRGDAPHFLLKEITESPNSFAKTLRGKIAGQSDGLRGVVGERALPAAIRERLADGTITRIRVIGQGTAAVAGQSTAAILDELTGSALDVDAITATELSGFHMRLDMSDTLAIAVSQSGTTTDTNRTVDLLRGRGAMVIGIVNRRGSDLTDKADGVLYTSDGRDVEMSVASTKAFYAQVAAGAVLSCAIAEAASLGEPKRRHQLLTALRELPDAMREVLERRPAIAEAARLAPPKRYWAVVGNGPNKVAAEEVRIKLSELCYKSMACDSTEDKKHIDLSSEPLILVCAAGLVGSTADDVAKEVAIFKAHKATPIVVANDGETRYNADATINVPPVDPALGFILSAMVGHLFGYEAALAIDASARPLREAREVVEQLAARAHSGDELLALVAAAMPQPAAAFHDGLRSGLYDGHLEASTAVKLSRIFDDVLADRPVEQYQQQTGKVGTPVALMDDLVAALSRAIDELTRPVDTIKHQAKTVTVGISRSDEGIIGRPLVQAVLNAGAGRDVLSYRTLKILADLDPAIAEVRGFTRYAVDGDSISVIDRGGIAVELESRVVGNAKLRGTKHRIASEREVLVAQGRSDGRTVIFVPEVKSGEAVGITLLHVAFHGLLPVDAMRGVLQGYDRRYDRLVDWVTETEGGFDDSLLAKLSVQELLVGPISDAANHWRS